jgi:hypothetical protein
MVVILSMIWLAIVELVRDVFRGLWCFSALDGKVPGMPARLCRYAAKILRNTG